MKQITPLYSALRTEADKRNIRMHTPGHKGKRSGNLRCRDLFQIDFTELEATGNLYKGLPPISDAEELMAKAAGAQECFFLTGGSTQGIMAAMAVACPLGGNVLVDRGCHFSVWNAMVHLDLHPFYVERSVLRPWDIAGPLTATHIKTALEKMPVLSSAVILTSPTYYGVLSDIPAIAKVTSGQNIPLIIDEAHGAHLSFLKGYAGAIAEGATLSIASAHKTLPALTPGALLFSNAQFSRDTIRERASMFGTSSPSYLVMASMDVARAFMQAKGIRRYGQVISAAEKLRTQINSRGVFAALSADHQAKIDPARLTINTAVGGIGGYDAAHMLEKNHIVCEMADIQNIVMILTCADDKADLNYIGKILSSMEHSARPAWKQSADQTLPSPLQKMSPREAAYAPIEYLPLAKTAGRIAGEHLVPYPPGTPAVAAGEEIDEAHISYLENNRWNANRQTAVIRE